MPAIVPMVKCWLALLFYALAAPIPAQEDLDQNLIELGQRIYQQGLAPGEPSVEIGSPPVSAPVRLFPCRNCHGADGRGSKEGGVSAPDITWTQLTKPYPLRTESGRERPPYDPASLSEAIREGIDSGGTRLSAAMPRYGLGGTGIAAITAYLQSIEHASSPGIDEHRIRIGLVPDTHDAAAREIAASTLSNYFAYLNDDGGIFGRDLSLVTGSPGRLARADLFLAIAYDADVGSKLLQYRRRNQAAVIPVIALFGSAERRADSADDGVLALYPGAERRRQALAAFAERELNIQPEDIQPLHAGAPAHQTPAALLLTRPEDLRFAPADTSASGVLLAACPLTPILRGKLMDYPLKVYATQTPDIGDVDENGRRNYLRLAKARAMPRAHLQQQLWYLAAAELLASLLSDCGRDLTTQKLLTAIQGRPQHTSGWGPTLRFGPQRSTGNDSVRVIPLNGAKSIQPD